MTAICQSLHSLGSIVNAPGGLRKYNSYLAIREAPYGLNVLDDCSALLVVCLSVGVKTNLAGQIAIHVYVVGPEWQAECDANAETACVYARRGQEKQHRVTTVAL